MCTPKLRAHLCLCRALVPAGSWQAAAGQERMRSTAPWPCSGQNAWGQCPAASPIHRAILAVSLLFQSSRCLDAHGHGPSLGLTHCTAGRITLPLSSSNKLDDTCNHPPCHFAFTPSLASLLRAIACTGCPHPQEDSYPGMHAFRRPSCLAVSCSHSLTHLLLQGNHCAQHY